MPTEIPTLPEIEQAIRRIIREELGRGGPEAMTTAQAAVYCGRTQKTVRTWIEQGGLPAARRGRLLTIRREDLERYLAGEGRTSTTVTADTIIASLKSTG